MKIGEYIRTPFGIRKIVDIKEDKGYKPRVKVLVLDRHLDTNWKFGFEFYTDEKVIKKAKHSFNIIDLIEVGDVVTIKTKYCTGDIYKVIDKGKSVVSLDCFQDGIMNVDNDDIKSIITKEQFRDQEYKVR